LIAGNLGQRGREIGLHQHPSHAVNPTGIVSENCDVFVLNVALSAAKFPAHAIKRVNEGVNVIFGAVPVEGTPDPVQVPFFPYHIFPAPKSTAMSNLSLTVQLPAAAAALVIPLTKIVFEAISTPPDVAELPT